MENRKYKYGLTLVEMLIVVAVIALLATMVVGIATRTYNQSKERGVKSVFVLLESALQEYHEYKSSFPEQPEKNFTNVQAHSEYIYGELYLIPESRKILERVSDSLIENRYGAAETPPEIYDLWGTALDYRYVAGDNFPEMVSAGPDRVFGTTDDISSKK